MNEPNRPHTEHANIQYNVIKDSYFVFSVSIWVSRVVVLQFEKKEVTGL